MHLRDILLLPQLHLSLLTEVDDALDRSVSGIFTTDLPDPGRYLSGGEIVLTGLVWHRGPASSERFAAALARAGITALGAGEAAFGVVPGDLTAACRRHNIPLFKVPVEISFNAILDVAAPAVWSERATGLSSMLSRHRGMISALASGAHLPEILPKVAEQLGIECWVLTAAGQQIAGTSSLPPESVRAALETFHKAVQLPAPGSGLTVHSAGGRIGRRWDAWCVVSRGGASGAIEELVSLVELERASSDERRRIQRLLTENLLRAASQDGDTGAVRAHLIACGLSPPLAVVAAQLSTVDRDTSALTLLDQVVGACVSEHDTHACAATERDGVAITLLSCGDDLAGHTARLRDALAVIEPSVRDAHVAVGISSVAMNADGVADAIEQAVNMANLAAAQPGVTALVANDQVTSHRLLLAGVPPQTRQAFHDRLLGPVLAYDRDRQAELVVTLRTFLDCSGSWQECAQLLSVHVNTLRYRLQRIEQLTGRDLSRFDDRVDLFLALRLNR